PGSHGFHRQHDLRGGDTRDASTAACLDWQDHYPGIGSSVMNRLVQLRQAHEQGEIKKQDYIEAIHALHAQLFAYPEFLQATDVEALSIRPEGVFVRSRSQQIELFLDPEDQHLVPCTLMNFRDY